MASYEGMTFGQTRFLRALRKSAQQQARSDEGSIKTAYRPQPETLRRWLEQPAFRKAYRKIRRALHEEMEAMLVQAGASAAATLVRAGAGAEGVKDDLHRRTLDNLVRLARAAIQSAANIPEEKEPKTALDFVHPSIPRDEAERLLRELDEMHREAAGHERECPAEVSGRFGR